MIPAEFDYTAPTGVDEALSVLREAAAAGTDVKVLGGGQSLMPVLRLRMAAPELVDLEVASVLRRRHLTGHSFSIVVVAEGALPAEGTMPPPEYPTDPQGAPRSSSSSTSAASPS